MQVRSVQVGSVPKKYTLIAIGKCVWDNTCVKLVQNDRDKSNGGDLTRNVAETIRHEIVSGKWAPEDRIPSERQLATTLGVSRVTVRRSLKLLCEEGMLVARRGSGYYPVVSLGDPAEIRNRRTIIFYYADESGNSILDLIDTGIINGANAEALRLGFSLFAVSRTVVNFTHALGRGLCGDLRGVILDWAASGLADTLHRRGIPFVITETRLTNPPGVCILQDNEGGTIKALERLFESGHRRIAVIANKSAGEHTEQRIAAYRRFVRDHSLPFENTYISRVPPHCGRRGIDGILQSNRKPSAIFVASDGLVSGALSELSDRGIGIPRDISIIGWVGADYRSEPAFASIDSVRWSSEEMGRLAVRHVVDFENISSLQEPIIVRVPVKLIERDSVAVEPVENNN